MMQAGNMFSARFSGLDLAGQVAPAGRGIRVSDTKHNVLVERETFSITMLFDGPSFSRNVLAIGLISRTGTCFLGWPRILSRTVWGFRVLAHMMG
jgi:hypothetical protein